VDITGNYQKSIFFDRVNDAIWFEGIDNTTFEGVLFMANGGTGIEVYRWTMEGFSTDVVVAWTGIAYTTTYDGSVVHLTKVAPGGTPEDVYAVESGWFIDSMTLDEVNTAIWLYVTNGTDIELRRFDTGTETIGSTITGYSDLVAESMEADGGRDILWISGGFDPATWYGFNATTGVLVHTALAEAGTDSYTIGESRVVWRKPGNAIYFESYDPTAPSGHDYGFKKYQWAVPPVVVTTPIQLGEIVADLSDRAGLDPAEIDVTELTQIVPGYAIARQTTIRGAIEAIRPAYYFDAVESEGIIKFKNRGSAPVATIPDEDLSARSSTSDVDPLETSRVMSVEIPRTVFVNYTLAATLYSTASKRATRLTGDSQEEVTIDLPLVLTDTTAQEVAEVNLHANWSQRLNYRFSLPKKYCYLDPTDLIVVKGHEMRIIKVSTMSKGEIKVEAVSDESWGYVPHVVVTETPPVYQQGYNPNTPWTPVFAGSPVPDSPPPAGDI
jgi:hypothetical protein